MNDSGQTKALEQETVEDQPDAVDDNNEGFLTNCAQSVRLTLASALVFGLLYSLVVTGFGQVLFHNQANGSLVYSHGKVIASSLIGQNFTEAKYFQDRPSATSNFAGTAPEPYDAEYSNADNLATDNSAYLADIKARVAAIRKENPSYTGEIPVDAVTTSFSGIDPNISIANALLQVNRVAAARHVTPSVMRSFVESHIQGRSLWVFGEPYINTTTLNIDLDQQFPN